MTPNTQQPVVMRSGADSLNVHTDMILSAIEGAIAFGKRNTNPPPSANHWLAKFWNIGRRLAELENPPENLPLSKELDPETACREAYDNTYHKVPAEIGYDHWRYVWMKACNSLARK